MIIVFSISMALLLTFFFPILKQEKDGVIFMSRINLEKVKESYGIDPKKELEGVWFPLVLLDGVKVRIAKAGNPKYEKLLKKLYKPYSKTMRKGKDIPQSAQDDITNELIANTILLDWSGMPGTDGTDVPFSIDEAMSLLSDPTLKELKEEISGYADEFAKFQADEVEELTKN